MSLDVQIEDEVHGSDDGVTVPCPDEECDETYKVPTRGAEISQTLTDECDGCGKKIWVSDNMVSPEAKFFNIYSGDGGGNNYRARYKRVDLDENIWRRIA